MSWQHIRDQAGAIALLQRAMAADRVAPAYLFVGPPSVGKALTARAFVQALNCDREYGAACGTCNPCRTIASGNHPDLLWARPEKRSRTISVATARTAAGALALAPQLGRHRVAVFDDADCLHRAAQNALLKTLEEPPARSLIVLVTSVPTGLLPTVRSRCQLVRFRPLAPTTVAALLEADGVPPAEARLAAGAANGGVAPARLLADARRVAVIRGHVERAIAGDAAGAAAEHARDLAAQEAVLEKAEAETAVDPELLSREQRKRAAEEQVAHVQRQMAERVEADLRLLALTLRDAVVARAAGENGPCLLGPPPAAFEQTAPTRLIAALGEIDRGLRYLRQYIRRDRVLFHVYTALAQAAHQVAA